MNYSYIKLQIFLTINSNIFIFLGLDLESVMALQTDLTSDEELSTTIDLSDAQAIRKQLDGLENMYTEVLKLLGTQK